MGVTGKGVAALTMDEDYQKRRREDMHRKPADGIESLARGGKGIVTVSTSSSLVSVTTTYT